MLGWLDHQETGGGEAAHALIGQIADDLAASGIALRGAVQISGSRDAAKGRCAMVLHILGDGGPDVEISQDLGPGAKGCRLDPGALEAAAQLVLDSLPGADLVIVNKFGKQELSGRGMVSVIAAAMEQGLPVLTSVAPDQRAEFLEFAGDLAVKLSPDTARDWCRRMTGAVPA